MRKRFTRDEREQLTPNAPVEWRNGRHWRPGTVIGVISRDEGSGVEYLAVRDARATRTRSGPVHDTLLVRPTEVRVSGS